MTLPRSSGYSQPVMSGLQHANAFVIQFRSDANLASGKLAGRIEHVASGATANFQSVEEVPEVLQRMLNEDELRDALLLVFANKQDLPVSF